MIREGPVAMIGVGPGATSKIESQLPLLATAHDESARLASRESARQEDRGSWPVLAFGERSCRLRPAPAFIYPTCIGTLTSAIGNDLRRFRTAAAILPPAQVGLMALCIVCLV